RPRSRRDRRAPPGLRRPLGRADPRDGCDDIDLRVRAARVLARRARAATAEVWLAEQTDARVAAIDHRGGGDLDRHHRRDRGAEAYGVLPCETVQLRRPARVHVYATRHYLTSMNSARQEATV